MGIQELVQYALVSLFFYIEDGNPALRANMVSLFATCDTCIEIMERFEERESRTKAFFCLRIDRIPKADREPDIPMVITDCNYSQ